MEKCSKKLKYKKCEDEWKGKTKREKPNIKTLAYELLVFTLSYLILTTWWYSDFSNLSSHIPHIKFGIPLSLFSLAVQLITCYEPVPLLHMFKLSKTMLYTLLLDWCHSNLSCMSSFWTRFFLVLPQTHHSMTKICTQGTCPRWLDMPMWRSA
jgi:hypothetical protein